MTNVGDKAARTGLLAITALFAFCALFACKPPAVNLAQGPRKYKPKHYDAVLKRWTREGKVIKHFDTNLHAYATYWSWDFTWAYAVKRAKVFRLTPARAKALRAGLLGEKAKHNEFYLAATTQEERWNDFDDSDSIWKITLTNDKGKQVDPTEIEEIDPLTAVHKSFFPYTKLFFKGYIVRFPRRLSDGTEFIPAGTRKFTLQIAGPKGVVPLTWKTFRK